MNFRKLITYLTMGTAAAMPLAVAQNPTILQGSYISNVFGNSNFIKNTNAQTNIADVTVSNATVTRSTTTPLVATSEFLVTTSTATGSATWSTRTFDSGMKGQNCEARFSYRGFSVGSTTAQILQGANVVAQLTLTASTDPRIASINFPCGDLSSATTFRLQQATASLTGTNEIGGIYVGLATNLGQLNTVGVWQSYTPTVTPSAGTLTSTGIDFAEWRRVGENIQIRLLYRATQSTANSFSWSITVPTGISLVTDTVTTAQSDRRTTINVTSLGSNVAGSVKVLSSSTFEVTPALSGGTFSSGTAYAINLDITQKVQGWGADPVVTPERQNVFGGVVYTAESQSLFVGSAEPTAYSSYNNSTWNKPAKLVGKAQVTTTNSGNDLGFSIPNMPVGAYKLQITGLLNAEPTSVTGVFAACNYKIVETTTSTDVAKQAYEGLQTASGGTRNFVNSFQGIFNNTSVATRNFRLEAKKYTDTDASNNSGCQAYSNTSASSIESNIAFTIIPLDQPSNSALYVQGPVQAAATGAAIPEGYVNEFATRSISDTSMRAQGSPTSGTWYYPWSGTLPLPAGNWLVCYKVQAQLSQSASTNSADIRTRIHNQTDDTTLSESVSWPTLGSSMTDHAQTHAACKPTAITSSKTFRVGIRYINISGAPTVNNIYLRGDQTTSELYAIRLN